jgi:hypothetical protein
MKKHIAGIAMLLLLGSFSWGQGTKQPFDVKKSREELEIMKEILNTTIKFHAQNSQTKPTRARFSSLSAFYLAGQGAVFVVTTSELRISGIPDFSYEFAWTPEYSQQMDALSQEISAMSREISREAAQYAQQQMLLNRYAADGGTGTGTESGQGGNAAPAPPTPPAPTAPLSSPAPPAPPAAPAPARTEIEREKLRKAVEDARGKAKQLREEAEANRQKFLQNLAELKIPLIEALANYGDSIATVKPEEYINLVLVTDGLNNQRTTSDVISARKSWITDYKAGRLTMDGFKQKVLQYNQ